MSMNRTDSKSSKSSSFSRQESEDSRSSADTGVKRKWMSTLKSKLSSAENDVGTMSEVSSFDEHSSCISPVPERGCVLVDLLTFTELCYSGNPFVETAKILSILCLKVTRKTTKGEKKKT
jgi:hypothetical protein